MRRLTPFSRRIDPDSAPSEPPSSEFDLFLSSEALKINSARQNHLASLGLELVGKRVLEVGAGIGLHTVFFEERGCSVLSTDGSPENVLEMRRRYPSRAVEVLDLNDPMAIERTGRFDVVYCYGTLYHLANPDEALAALGNISDMILLETLVALGRYPECHLVREPAEPNQSISLIGCRPTRSWVMESLRSHFQHAYITVTQPDHPDFEQDWTLPTANVWRRAVFVGSKSPIVSASLTEELPMEQPLRLPRRSKGNA